MLASTTIALRAPGAEVLARLEMAGGFRFSNAGAKSDNNDSNDSNNNNNSRALMSQRIQIDA